MAVFTNLTRGNEIGANSYLLNLGCRRFLLDAGMHPKLTGQAATPNLQPANQQPLDAIFLTHAHLDHVGCLPLAQLAHPDVKVFMTLPTRHLAEPLLFNSVNVMKRQREELDIAEYPLFTRNEVHDSLEQWQPCPLNRDWSLNGTPHAASAKEDCWFRFHHAGHILGSAMVELADARRRVLYTGDICLHNQTLMTAAVAPQGPFDLLIVETTRGAQPSHPGQTRELLGQELVAAIQTVFQRGGSVLMPIFAMGKTQEILTLLHQAIQRGELPGTVLHIGGLGKVFTRVYDETADLAERAHPTLDLMQDIRPQIFDLRKLKKFTPKTNNIYLLPSGMMTENTTANLVASHFLAHEEDAVFFVGYSDPDSPAGQLRRAAALGKRVILDPRYGDQPIRCEVRHFDFTSHAKREDLLDFIIRLQPKKTALVHGDHQATAWFQAELAQHLPQCEVFIPAPGKAIEF